MDEKLAIIKKAMEMGADVKLGFYGNHQKEEAEAIAKEIVSVTGGSYKIAKGDIHRWFDVAGKIQASIFFEPCKEDKIRDLEKQLEELRS